MTFRLKIFLALASVGCVPLALLGWQTVSINHQEVTRAVGSAQASTARAAAAGCEKWVAQSVERLRLSVGYLPYGALSDEELGAVLAIPFRQVGVDVLVVLDGQGVALAPPLHATAAAPGVKPITQADLDRFASKVPFSSALAAGTALGPTWLQGGTARLPVALRVSEQPLRVVAAQLSLRELSQQMRELSERGEVAWLANREGEVLAQGGSVPRPGPALAGLLAAATSGGAPLVEVLELGGEEWLAAAAPVGDLGWTVVVGQPASVAFRAARLVRTYTLFWAAVALLLTGLLGFFLSRGLSDPIRRLSAAARELSEGRYQGRVEVQAKDELGEFASAFNHMSGELLRRDQEIRAWNTQLQQRVEERTAELRQAQEQILRSRRLAALGSLGAGIVHELNNPLMGLTGTAALLQRELGADPRHAELLKTMGAQARRVSAVAENLRRFAEQEHAAAGQRFNFSGALQTVLDAHLTECKERKIQIATSIASGLPEVQGNPLQLQEAVAQLVRNAIQAMPAGGELRVTLSGVAGDAVKLTVGDTGRGIPPELRDRIFDPFFSTKDQGGGAGLGLSIAHTIITAHHGELAVDSALGGGALFTVVLPAAAAAAHLS